MMAACPDCTDVIYAIMEDMSVPAIWCRACDAPHLMDDHQLVAIHCGYAWPVEQTGIEVCPRCYAEFWPSDYIRPCQPWVPDEGAPAAAYVLAAASIDDAVDTAECMICGEVVALSDGYDHAAQHADGMACRQFGYCGPDDDCEC